MVLPVRTAAAGDRVPAPVGGPERANPTAGIRAVDAFTANWQTFHLRAEPPAWNAMLADVHLSEGAALIAVIGALGAMLGLHFKARSYIREVAGVKESGAMTITGQPLVVTEEKQYATKRELRDVDKKVETLRGEIIPRSEIVTHKDLGSATAAVIAAGDKREARIIEQMQKSMSDCLGLIIKQQHELGEHAGALKSMPVKK